jgi:AcrR family transcriptional regulator
MLCNTVKVSPRRLDPKNRAVLVDIAARLISEDGPSALTARRVAAEAGTSTMAVYTHFGGMSGLVREIVHEGFARLQQLFDQVEQTSDPVADLALTGLAYRRNAISNGNVYGVMFGSASLAGFALTDEDRQYGRFTLTRVVDHASRCIEAGRFRREDPVLVAHQMWLAVHGTVSLELGAYLAGPYDADRCFEAQLISLMTGQGDDRKRAAESVAVSAERFGARTWPA